MVLGPPRHLNEEVHRGLVPQDQLGSGSDGSGDHFLADDQTYKSIPPSSGDLQGYAWKLPVYVATITAGTLASDFEDGDTVDGIALVTAMRILVKDQSAQEENGIYIVEASGPPTRATDADSGDELVAAAVSVGFGTSAGTSWVCTAPDPITLDTDPLPWLELRTLNDSPFPLVTYAGLDIRPWAAGGTSGEGINLQANDATGSGTGGTTRIGGGNDSADGFSGATFEATGADPTGHGKAAMITGGTYGDEGDVPSVDADGYLVYQPKIATIQIVIDGGGSAITTGIKADLDIEFDGEVLSWALLADQSGDIAIDLWKDVTANFPPDVADTMIGAGTQPELSTADHDSAAVDWDTPTITAGDTLRINVDSAATVTRVTLALKVRRTT